MRTNPNGPANHTSGFHANHDNAGPTNDHLNSGAINNNINEKQAGASYQAVGFLKSRGGDMEGRDSFLNMGARESGHQIMHGPHAPSYSRC